MGNDFNSISSASLSACSLSASGMFYNYLNGIHKNNLSSKELSELLGITENQLKLKMKKFKNMKFQQF